MTFYCECNKRVPKRTTNLQQTQTVCANCGREIVKLQPGDYVSTEGMTEGQYHDVCKAFIDAGAIGCHRNFEKDMTFIIWDKTDRHLFRSQNKVDYRNHLRTTRELTVSQIINQEEDKMNIVEAYKIMQANCGIEVGDTVKVLRKAESYENGWENQWSAEKSDYIGKSGVVISLDDGDGVKIKFPETWWRYPFFVLELVKKAPKLPEPIRISSQYRATFREDGGIIVGCQSFDFETLEKVYLAAKGVKEND